MEELVNKTLLFDYFVGQVSPIQKKLIESWLAQPGNQDLYYQWLHEWELMNLQLTTNWQTAFTNTKQRIDNTVSDNSLSETIPLRWWTSKWIGTFTAAASILLAVSVTNWLTGDIVRYQTIGTGYGEARRYVLPDGSVVDLNANSSIRFSRFGFSEPSVFASLLCIPKERRVALMGEADFSVRHLPSHRRFVVLTGTGLTVNVLGTQFTVFTRDSRTQVVLRSGKVELTMPTQTNQPAMTMKPGDLVMLDAQGKLAIRQTAHPENLSVWKQHRFSFEATSLREIAQMLRDNYGLTVMIEGGSLADRTISGSFPAQDANEVIRLVAELLQINYFRENNNVTFTN